VSFGIGFALLHRITTRQDVSPFTEVSIESQRPGIVFCRDRCTLRNGPKSARGVVSCSGRYPRCFQNRGRCRVRDRGALCRGRHFRAPRAGSAADLKSFVVSKVKHFVFDDGSAGSCSELISSQYASFPRSVEIITSVEGVVSQELIGSAV